MPSSSCPLLEQGLRIADEMDAVSPLLQSADQSEELSLAPAPDAFRIDEQEGDHCTRNQIFMTIGLFSGAHAGGSGAFRMRSC